MQTNYLHKMAVWCALAAILIYPAATFVCQSPSSEQASTASGSRAKNSYRQTRESMVRQQIEARGVRDERVLKALRKVPRHLFVPTAMQPFAYRDSPLPIGQGQTISQPYIVAFMTEALALKPKDRVLEVGTGSGYQAAVLSLLVKEVYSIEIVEPLATVAAERLRRLGYTNVQVRTGDGYQGWHDAAPFDAIIVTAAPDHVPQPLLDQLAVGGRLVLPVGKQLQTLVRIRRTHTGFKKEVLLPVQFVPMTGETER